MLHCYYMLVLLFLSVQGATLVQSGKRIDNIRFGLNAVELTIEQRGQLPAMKPTFPMSLCDEKKLSTFNLMTSFRCRLSGDGGGGGRNRSRQPDAPFSLHHSDVSGSFCMRVPFRGAMEKIESCHR
jgi:hypothetical protein